MQLCVLHSVLIYCSKNAVVFLILYMLEHLLIPLLDGEDGHVYHLNPLLRSHQCREELHWETKAYCSV